MRLSACFSSFFACLLLLSAPSARSAWTLVDSDIINGSHDGLDIMVKPDSSIIIYGHNVFNNLLVPDGAWVHNPAGDQMDVTVTGDVLIEPSGHIDANGRGYGAGSGPYSGSPGAGGSHGGVGSGGIDAYGSITQPVTSGSGGYWNGDSPGGAGGGAIRLNVAGTLTVNGYIEANGLIGSYWGGGGAGGSIWLTAGTLTGTGKIHAMGGESGGGGGSGGGGRIALTYGSNTFSGQLYAWAGPGPGRGGAGTIYTKANSETVPTLRVDNGYGRGGNTPLGFSETMALGVLNGGVAEVRSPLSLYLLEVEANSAVSSQLGAAGKVTVGNWTSFGNTSGAYGKLHLETGLLTIHDNSALIGSIDFTVTQNMVLDDTSVIDASGLGFGAGSGPGASPACGGGGSHGGRGGVRDTSDVYDSILIPVEPGSGGRWCGDNGGGAGGGTVRIACNGNFVLDGRIMANGNGSGSTYGGGGAGGSVLITTGVLQGEGSLQASGGLTGIGGGGGGGGRIAVYYGDNQFDGTMEAFGGPGGASGGAGTIYTKHGDPPGHSGVVVGTVLLDNNGVAGESTPISTSDEAFEVIVCRGATMVQKTPVEFGSLMLGVGGTYLENDSLIDATVYGPVTLDGGCINGSGRILATGDVTVGANSSWSTFGMGFGANSGPGAGSECGSGGSYGGLGGGAGNGTTYGSSTQPVDKGSGGNWCGDNGPGSGGGAIRLKSGGIMRIDGPLTSNGRNSPSSYGGGGSGGSIWLEAGTLKGSAPITADGGCSGCCGGGGGGGRIAIYFDVIENFTSAVTANGGCGGAPGQPGTIFTNNQIPDGLEFLTQPANTRWQEVIQPAVHVALVDINGNPLIQNTDSITLAIKPGTGAADAVLSGTLTSVCHNGVAEFPDLTIDKLGTGYVLTAVSGSWTKDSAPFDMIAFSFVMNDVSRILKWYSGIETGPNVLFNRYNVVDTGDSAGRIDLADAFRVLRKALGIESNP
jgi:hypothetical protein